MFLFPLFYVIREFHRLLHRGKAEGGNMSITRSITVAQIDNRFEAR